MDLTFSSVMYWGLSGTRDFSSHIEIQAKFFCAIANWSSLTFVATCCFEFVATSFSAAFDLSAGLSATFFGWIDKIKHLGALCHPMAKGAQ